MAETGRLLVILGVALVVIGGIVMLVGRTGLPLGRLPGDFFYRGKNSAFYFPLASSILIRACSHYVNNLGVRCMHGNHCRAV